MDDAVVFMIVFLVCAGAVGIGALFALDYWRKRQGIEPPPYVPRENEIDVFAGGSFWSGLLALVVVSVLAYFSPVDALALSLVGAFFFMRAGLKRHEKTGVLTRMEVGLALSEGLLIVTMWGMVAGACMFRITGVQGLGLFLVSTLVGVLVCALAGGGNLRTSKLPAMIGPLMLCLQPSAWMPSLFATSLDRTDACEFVQSAEAYSGREFMTSDEWAGALRELTSDGGETPDVSRVLKAALNKEDRRASAEVREAKVVAELAEYSYLQGRDYDEIGALQFAWLLEGNRGWHKDTVLLEVIERLSERDLSDEERLALATRLGETPLRASKSGPLRDVIARLQALDQLGHPEQGAAYAQATHELIMNEDLKYGTEAYDAVYLMRRFGVPKGFDLEALHVSLDVEARDPLFGSVEIDQVLAFLARSAIERLPEWQPMAKSRSGWLFRVWQYRIAWISVSIAIACVWITARTPEGVSPPVAV